MQHNSDAAAGKISKPLGDAFLEALKITHAQKRFLRQRHQILSDWHGTNFMLISIKFRFFCI